MLKINYNGNLTYQQFEHLMLKVVKERLLTAIACFDFGYYYYNTLYMQIIKILHVYSIDLYIYIFY